MRAVGQACRCRRQGRTGTVRSQVEGLRVREYRTGETWTRAAELPPLVSANASKTKPARLLAYVIADDGAKAAVDDE